MRQPPEVLEEAEGRAPACAAGETPRAAEIRKEIFLLLLPVSHGSATWQHILKQQDAGTQRSPGLLGCTIASVGSAVGWAWGPDP